ncbi:hypothetical protein COLO4_05672 [Corchorus olitorius]|uniref:Uncharacterized protein n=1 Tax=Corchorus olitorius TaxID=93759 RepID=A0A1R3KQ60_9ROSI|nr:hypothetical protein COLO4_05672 [Corchorus olitorius]
MECMYSVREMMSPPSVRRESRCVEREWEDPRGCCRGCSKMGKEISVWEGFREIRVRVGFFGGRKCEREPDDRE